MSYMDIEFVVLDLEKMSFCLRGYRVKQILPTRYHYDKKCMNCSKEKIHVDIGQGLTGLTPGINLFFLIVCHAS